MALTVTHKHVAVGPNAGNGEVHLEEWNDTHNVSGTLSADDVVDGTTNKVFTATDENKLNGIEAGADVTDATNVAAAGAFMKATDDLDDITAGTTNKHFTDTEKNKLSGIADSATANSSDATLLNRANHTGTQSADTITDGTTNKVYTATEKSKLSGIAAGAEVNVQADWNAVSGDAQILNKPTLGTASGLDSIDEDDMASNSDTRLPTQQSVKAYVDANSGGSMTLISSASASGATWTLTTGVSGKKRMLVKFDNVSHNNGSSATFCMQVTSDGGTTWYPSNLATCAILSSVPNSTLASFFILIEMTPDGQGIFVTTSSMTTFVTTLTPPNFYAVAPTSGGASVGTGILTAALNGIRFLPSAGSFDAGTISVYGV